jgi:hypothetical protein
MDLETKLRQTGLSGSSVHNYLRIIKLLNDDKETDTLDFLKDTDTVIKRIKTVNQARVKNPGLPSDNTIKSRYTTVLSCIRKTIPLLDNPEYKNIYDIYRAEFDKISNTIMTHLESGEKTEREQVNWISSDEIKTVLNNLKEKAESEDAKYKHVQDYLLVSLYTTLPPQRLLEFYKMRVILGKVPIKLSEEYNYLLFDDKKMIIYQHKNTTKSGKKEIDLSKYPEFIEAFVLYLIKTRVIPLKSGVKYMTFSLLRHEHGIPWDRPDMIRERLNSIFKKRIGSGMLRKIISTEKAPAKNVMKEYEEFATEMGHSVSTNSLYYVKN